MHTDEEKKMVRSLSRDGHSLRKIAEITGISKSTVADLIRAETRPIISLNTHSDLSEKCPASNDRQSREKPYSFSDYSGPFQEQKSPVRTPITLESDNSRPNPGQNNRIHDYLPSISDNSQVIAQQNNFQNQIPMMEPEEKQQNRTEIPFENLSQGSIELKKYELNLHHEREMRKMDQVDAQLRFQQEEAANRKQALQEIREKKADRADYFNAKIMVLTSDLLNRVELNRWSTSEVHELFNNASELHADFIAFCKKYDITYMDSEPFLFLKWLINEIESWLDEIEEADYEDDEVFTIDISGKDIKILENAYNINFSRML